MSSLHVEDHGLDIWNCEKSIPNMETILDVLQADHFIFVARGLVHLSRVPVGNILRLPVLLLAQHLEFEDFLDGCSGLQLVPHGDLLSHVCLSKVSCLFGSKNNKLERNRKQKPSDLDAVILGDTGIQQLRYPEQKSVFWFLRTCGPWTGRSKLHVARTVMHSGPGSLSADFWDQREAGHSGQRSPFLAGTRAASPFGRGCRKVCPSPPGGCFRGWECSCQERHLELLQLSTNKVTPQPVI